MMKMKATKMMTMRALVRFSASVQSVANVQNAANVVNVVKENAVKIKTILEGKQK